MSLRQSVLLGLVVTGVAFGASVYVHPQGLHGVLELIGLEGLAPAAGPADAGDGESGTGAAARLSNAELVAGQMTQADLAYDRGDFTIAVTFYMLATNAAPGAATRARAAKGLHRALLAWALTDAPPPADFAGRSAHARLAELREQARSQGTEEAWLELALFAKAAGLDVEAPGAVGAALDLAVVGGPVERRILNVVPRAAQRQKPLREALSLRGLGAGASGGTGSGATGLRHPTETDDGPSGIGGTGQAPRISVPFGAFSPAVRQRLKRAVVAEREGLEHFRLAGPEGTDRSTHRSAALRLLREARDIYSEALEEDEDSSAAQARLQQVMRALGQLNKEVVSGD